MTAGGCRLLGQLDQRGPRHPGPVLPLAPRDIAITDEFGGRRGDIQGDKDKPVTARLKDRTDPLTGTM